MSGKLVTRRMALQIGSTFTFGALASREVSAEDPVQEVTLSDEPTMGYYGRYDLTNFGPPALRNVKKNFVFPDDVEVDSAYGIDVSHHSRMIPWTGLKQAKINYVYIKASQSKNARDGKFVENWKSCVDAQLPCGAYHFLTAGVPGKDQANQFIRRLSEIGGLKAGNLQPVVDLEWDIFGPNFKRVVIGHNPQGDPIFKDYWDDVSRTEIVEIVNDSISALVQAHTPLNLKPLVYTNRSWWEEHVPEGTVFKNASVWISDYRRASFRNNSPRSVSGHEYYLWQFTETGKIKVGNRRHGPYDCNKLVFGGIENITI